MTAKPFPRRQALALPLLLAGCNRKSKKTVGVVPMGRSHMFWQSVHAGAAKAATETGVDIEWNGPASESDKAAQLQIVETMINKRLDAIALAPIDKTALANVVERAAREGIPVVIFDSPVDTDQFVAQIATDNYQGGVLAAERIGAIIGGKGKVAVVAVQVGFASTMAREKGFEDTIRSRFPAIAIADKRFGEADVAKSLRVAENILTAHPDIDALFASNESSTVGSAQALKARTGSKVKLVGFDAGPSLESDLRAGVIDALVVQHPFQMGYKAVHSIAAKFKGEQVQKIQNLPPRLVTKENTDTPEVREQLNPDLKKYLG